jgi:DnaJ-class molecular chaperone
MTLADRLRQSGQVPAQAGRPSGPVQVPSKCGTCGGTALVYMPWVGDVPCRDCGGSGVKASETP